MRFLIIAIFSILLFNYAEAQTIKVILADSLLVKSSDGSAELILENSTAGSTGDVLTNTGNGRTSFKPDEDYWDTLPASFESLRAVSNVGLKAKYWLDDFVFGRNYAVVPPVTNLPTNKRGSLVFKKTDAAGNYSSAFLWSGYDLGNVPAAGFLGVKMGNNWTGYATGAFPRSITMNESSIMTGIEHRIENNKYSFISTTFNGLPQEGAYYNLGSFIFGGERALVEGNKYSFISTGDMTGFTGPPWGHIISPFSGTTGRVYNSSNLIMVGRSEKVSEITERFEGNIISIKDASLLGEGGTFSEPARGNIINAEQINWYTKYNASGPVYNDIMGYRIDLDTIGYMLGNVINGVDFKIEESTVNPMTDLNGPFLYWNDIIGNSTTIHYSEGMRDIEHNTIRGYANTIWDDGSFIGGPVSPVQNNILNGRNWILRAASNNILNGLYNIMDARQTGPLGVPPGLSFYGNDLKDPHPAKAPTTQSFFQGTANFSFGGAAMIASGSRLYNYRGFRSLMIGSSNLIKSPYWSTGQGVGQTSLIGEGLRGNIYNEIVVGTNNYNGLGVVPTASATSWFSGDPVFTVGCAMPSLATDTAMYTGQNALQILKGTGHAGFFINDFANSPLNIHPIAHASGAHLTSGGVWTDASDSVKKYDISDIPYGTSTLLQLTPRTFNYKTGEVYADVIIRSKIEEIQQQYSDTINVSITIVENYDTLYIEDSDYHYEEDSTALGGYVNCYHYNEHTDTLCFKNPIVTYDTTYTTPNFEGIEWWRDNQDKINDYVSTGGSANIFDNAPNAIKTQIFQVDSRRVPLDKTMNLGDYANVENTKVVGFVAQEVESIIPEAVFGAEGEKSLDYNAIMATLVKTVQELEARIQILENP